MSKSNKVCPVCGKKMKQQFIGLQHCKCGMVEEDIEWILSDVHIEMCKREKKCIIATFS